MVGEVFAIDKARRRNVDMAVEMAIFLKIILNKPISRDVLKQE